jgi:small-conductance mechanosensitive channel/CRP-like cAMP-binding protein
MNKNILYLLIWIVCVSILACLYYIADPISPNNTGSWYYIEQLVKSAIMLIAAWLTSRFTVIVFFKPIEKRRQKPLPKIVKDLSIFIIFAAVMMFILLVIYNKDIGWFVVTLGSSTALLGYINQDIVKDCFSGIIFDVQRSMEVGDWIVTPSGDIGKVIRIGMLDTDVQTPDGVVTTIFNSTLRKDIFTNRSKPNPDFWLRIPVSLAQDIDIRRATRLLQSAAMSTEGIWKQMATVLVSEANGGNIVYDVRVRVPNYGDFCKVRHNAITAITQKLAQHGISYAEDGGVQTVIMQEASETPTTTTALDVINLVSLFTGCTDSEKKEIAKFMTPREYSPNEVIIEEKSFGATMYFIAEGVVEVSLALEQQKSDDKDEPKKQDDHKNKKPGKTVKKSEKRGKIKAKDDKEATKDIAIPQEEKDLPALRCHICYIANNSFFGENGVLYDSPRNARVSAYSDTLIYELTKESLIKIVKKNPVILEKITDVIVARTQEREAIKEKEENALNKKDDMKSKFLTAFKKFLGL